MTRDRLPTSLPGLSWSSNLASLNFPATIVSAAVPVIGPGLAMAERTDDGTNDLVVSQVLRSNELQTCFLSEHVVNVPLVKAEGSNGYRSLKQA